MASAVAEGYIVSRELQAAIARDEQEYQAQRSLIEQRYREKWINENPSINSTDLTILRGAIKFNLDVDPSEMDKGGFYSTAVHDVVKALSFWNSEKDSNKVLNDLSKLMGQHFPKAVEAYTHSLKICSTYLAHLGDSKDPISLEMIADFATLCLAAIKENQAQKTGGLFFIKRYDDIYKEAFCWSRIAEQVSPARVERIKKFLNIKQLV